MPAKEYVLRASPSTSTRGPDTQCVWAFDLGKASIGEAVRRGTQFLHKASLLIPAEFAESKSAASRRRMNRTHNAHYVRARWRPK